MASYSSTDFHAVHNTLSEAACARLHHPDVDQTQNRDAEMFSQERGHRVCIVDLPSFSISVTIGWLKPSEKTRLHRHNYETILYILAGEGRTRIGDHVVSWRAGDAVYIPVWYPHDHQNLSEVEPAKYIACENAPLLQNLGNIACREELG